jgi:hypothetical protein
MNTCQAYVQMHRTKSIHGELATDQEPEGELTTLGTLYFPELAQEIASFSFVWHSLIGAGLALQIETQQAGQDQSARQEAWKKFEEGWTSSYKALVFAAAALKQASRKLLVEISGVTD